MNVFVEKVYIYYLYNTYSLLTITKYGKVKERRKEGGEGREEEREGGKKEKASKQTSLLF